jgi:transposase InsO family protein
MDSASVLTRRDGELALFFVMEHWNSECLGWYLSRGSDKEGAVNAMSAALEHLGVERIPGLTLRVDHWTGFRSPEFIHHLEQADIGLSLSFPMRPWQNGVAERFVRTIREQLLSLAEFVSFHDAVQAIGEFMHNYNHHWLLGRLGFLSPAERRFSFQELRA